MLVECGDAFPEAAEWSMEYLRPLEGRRLYRLDKNGHVAQYPDSMLRVLDGVVDANVLADHQKYSLLEILDKLVAANAEMTRNLRYLKLYRIATQ